MIRAQVVGATGYGGIGIVELLLRHPEIEVVSLLAKTDVGRPLSDFFPHLRGFCDQVVEDALPERVGADCDVAIFATPDRVGMQHAAQVLAGGAAMLDYSGDFRFDRAERYQRYADRHPSVGGRPHTAPELLGQSAYGIPELYRERIRRARLVGNPGCFAVPMILALAPALKDGLIEPGRIAVDGKTGISGAGKKPGPALHFPDRDGDVRAYRPARHQHVVEAQMALAAFAGGPVGLTFVPHYVPVTRGILVTAYADLRRDTTESDVYALYHAFYEGEPFVRVFPPGVICGLKTAVGSNLCDISFALDRDNGRLVLMGVVDNLLKGQAGSALQNMNAMFGLPETLGLERTPQYP